MEGSLCLSFISGWSFCPLTLFAHVCPSGNPKGAMITHRNIVSDASGFVKVTEVNFWDAAIFLYVHWVAVGLENESGKGRGEMPLVLLSPVPVGE